jgi:hypothetical protein
MVPNLRFRGKLRTSFPGSIFSHAVLAQPWTVFCNFLKGCFAAPARVRGTSKTKLVLK